MLVAIGLHEAPGGRGEDLTWLLAEHGFTADYADRLRARPATALVAAHMGQATVEIEITREGMPTHELQTPAGTPNPILVAARVIEAVRARNEELAATEHPWVGAETYFLGEVHGGDFYNRHPATCRLVGTRRWAPGNTLAAVQAEYDALLAPIAAESGCTIDVQLKLVRDAYSIDPEHPLARRPRAAATRRSPARRSSRPASRWSPTARSSRPSAGSRPSTTARAARARTRTSSRSRSTSSSASTRIYLATLERLWRALTR